ncbi:hypothetical protein KW797_00430 [Candidatus Parcubacteria bacterium]|nr:hypothetical protein [Candidatus Parcubacteria bacterium]
MNRIGAASILTTIALATGIGFVIQAGNNSAQAVVHQVKTQDGRSRLVQTGSGAQVGSGHLLVDDQKTGSGELEIGGTDGGRACYADTDGTGYTYTDCNNGVCTDRTATAAECLQR